MSRRRRSECIRERRAATWGAAAFLTWPPGVGHLFYKWNSSEIFSSVSNFIFLPAATVEHRIIFGSNMTRCKVKPARCQRTPRPELTSGRWRRAGHSETRALRSRRTCPSSRSPSWNFTVLCSCTINKVTNRNKKLSVDMKNEDGSV